MTELVMQTLHAQNNGTAFSAHDVQIKSDIFVTKIFCDLYYVYACDTSTLFG